MERDQDILIYFLNHWMPSTAIWRRAEFEVIKQEKFVGHILEIGCGDGYFSGYIFVSGRISKSSSLIGLDIDRKQLVKGKNMNVFQRVLVADIHNLPFPDSSFDYIFSNCVIEHISPLENAIGEISRVMKKDGTILISTLTDHFRNNLLLSQLFSKLRIDLAGRLYASLINNIFQHKNFCSVRQWEEMLNRYNLNLISYKYIMPRKLTLLWDLMLLPGIPIFVAEKIFSSTFGLNRIINFLLNRFVFIHLSCVGEEGSGIILKAIKS